MDNQEPKVNPTQDPPTSPVAEAKRSSHRGLVIYLVVLILIMVGVAVLAEHHKKSIQTTSSSTAQVTAADVSISKTGFVPQAITINAGQAIVWTNNDSSPHQVASDPYPTNNTLPGLNSKTPILPDHTYAYVFKAAGTYTYHDNLNPYTFKGTIIVK